MTKIVKSFYLFMLASVMFPLAAGAQAGSIPGIIANVQTTLLLIISLLFVLATLVFIWGVITYVIRSDPEKKAEARHTMTYGIIGLAVMAAAWGIVQLLINYFGVGGGAIPTGVGSFGSTFGPAR